MSSLYERLLSGGLVRAISNPMVVGSAIAAQVVVLATLFLGSINRAVVSLPEIHHCGARFGNDRSGGTRAVLERPTEADEEEDEFRADGRVKK